jgi:hypothetical protein
MGETWKIWTNKLGIASKETRRKPRMLLRPSEGVVEEVKKLYPW